MATIDLSTTNSYPRTHTQASVGTTWDEFLLPGACTKVTVEGEGTAIFVAWDADGAVESGAVSATARKKWAADVSGQYFRRSVRGGSGVSGSVFVAAQSSTVTVTLILEKD